MNDVMNKDYQQVLDELTTTLLYEGYTIFPYHNAALKNKKPIQFGVVFPCVYAEKNANTNSLMQTQCIVLAKKDQSISFSIKFLHLIKVELLKKLNEKYEPADVITINDKSYTTGWQGIEREVSLNDITISELLIDRKILPVFFPESKQMQNVLQDDGVIAGRQIFSSKNIKGTVEIETRSIQDKENAFIVTVQAKNTTEIMDAEKRSRDEAMQHAFIATHTILSTNGKFVSDQNPGEWKSMARECKNLNTYPVLINEEDSILLSSPIILYDYPQINSGSKGDLFDSTEMEEALWLHVNMLTDHEKQQALAANDKIREMMDKAGKLQQEEILMLHNQMKFKNFDI